MKMKAGMEKERGNKDADKAGHECVSPDALAQLAAYQYSSIDNSLMTHYVLRHYVEKPPTSEAGYELTRGQWNWFVKLMPLWLAPNMVTLIGFGFIIANVGLLAVYMPDLVGPGPSWLYFSFAFGLFAYQTMDNIDGKQARRTGQSSGLGELFDHGIDSLNCTLASLLETAAMGLGTSRRGVFTALIPCLPMFFSTWETYHTHTLYLGYFNGPTEGLLIACTVMILSGIYGPGIWHAPLADTFSFLPDYLGNLAVIDIWIPLLLTSLLIAHLPECTYNVYLARKRQNLPFLPVFLEWIPLAIFTGSTGAWLYSPYSTLMAENHLMLFCLTMSFVFGRMTTKVILAHLTRRPFPYWTVMLVPLVGGAVVGNLPLLGLRRVDAVVELWYLRTYFLFALLAYFNWAFFVTGKICKYLDINCLTITPRLLYKGTETGRDAKARAEAEGSEDGRERMGSVETRDPPGGGTVSSKVDDGSPVVEKSLRSRKVVGHL